jgi:hypothetical protein
MNEIRASGKRNSTLISNRILFEFRANHLRYFEQDHEIEHAHPKQSLNVPIQSTIRKQQYCFWGKVEILD